MTASPRTEDRCDCLIVGGGPAGSAAAIELARLGHHVVLLEKASHPRFHIGESLLPMSMPILDRLGVLDQVRAIGIEKYAADFPTEGGCGSTARGYECFEFADALRDSPSQALQVRRAEFDALLFAAARKAGADCREQTLATKLTVQAEGYCVDTEAEGLTHRWQCRYLIDASGRDTFFAQARRIKDPDPRHRSAALYRHYQGVARRPSPHEGNISIYRLDDGWAWFIPLPDQQMSVGVVGEPALFKRLRGATDVIATALAAVPDAAARMASAMPFGESIATGNYSYRCRQMDGARHALIGDAYAFLDPIFSSGVHLALTTALDAAQLADATLRNRRFAQARARWRFRRRTRAAQRRFGWFIYRFRTPAIRHLFANPRDVLGMRRAVISLLAGDVHRGGSVSVRLALFRIIYAVTGLTIKRTSPLATELAAVAAVSTRQVPR